METTKLTESDLYQFTGTEHYYRTALNPRVVYTDGVQYLAEKAQAYWLVDDIAAVLLCESKVRAEEFQVWTLKTEGDAAVLTCTDGGKGGHREKVLYTQHYEFTTFPLDEIKLYCEYDGTRHVLLLPSEH